MIHPRSQLYGLKMLPMVASERTQESTFPPERHTSSLTRRRGGLISVPREWKMLETERGRSHCRLTKLLLNVTIERSLGPVHVVMSPENTVSDLITSVVDIYVKEKRRPLVKNTDPQCFRLHYSQFSLQSIKADEKLMELRSRSFFLCAKDSSSSVNSCSKEAEKEINSPLMLIMLMDFLL